MSKREKWRMPWYCMGCGLKVIYKDEEHVCVETESVPVAVLRATRAVVRAAKASDKEWRDAPLRLLSPAEVRLRYALRRLTRVSK